MRCCVWMPGTEAVMFAQFDVIVFMGRFSKIPEYIEKHEAVIGRNNRPLAISLWIMVRFGAFGYIDFWETAESPSLRPNKIILMNAQRRKLTLLLVGDSVQFCSESSNNKHSWRLKRAKELNGTSTRPALMPRQPQNVSRRWALCFLISSVAKPQADSWQIVKLISQRLPHKFRLPFCMIEFNYLQKAESRES